jgi:hypothetical protein
MSICINEKHFILITNINRFRFYFMYIQAHARSKFVEIIFYQIKLNNFNIFLLLDS